MTVIPGFKYQKGDVTITIQRFCYTDRATMGQYNLDGKTYYTLEPACHVAEHPCIRQGKYPVRIAISPKRKKPVIWLDGVPDRAEIQIHPGNYPKDTEGCILPGMDKKLDCVTGSTTAFDILLACVRSLIKSGIKVYIEVKDVK